MTHKLLKVHCADQVKMKRTEKRLGVVEELVKIQAVHQGKITGCSHQIETK